MSRVLRRTAARGAVFALALAGLTMSSLAPAAAGDIDAPRYGGPPVYGPYPNGGAAYERGPAPCRIVLERRIDPYGREVVRRVRVCDEGAGYAPGYEAGVPPGYGYPPRYYEPAPSEYYGAPRPPAPMGPRYYD